MNKEQILIEGISKIAKEVIEFISSSSEHLCNTKMYKDDIDKICQDTIKQLSIKIPIVINTSVRRTYSIDEVFIDCNTNLTMIVKKNIKTYTNCDDCYYSKVGTACPNSPCGIDKYYFKLKDND